MRGESLDGHALYLDVDGTILDLALTPDRVEVPEWLVPTLQRLADQLDGAVALVSGRTVRAIDALFNPLRLPAVAVHGGQIRLPSGVVLVDEPLAAALQCAGPLLERAIVPLRGVQLENKHCAMALHYRGAPESGREVLKIAEVVASGLGPQFAVLVGQCVVEIRPRHLTKGAGLQRLMEEAPFRGRTPIFAGDDLSDEDAFQVVNRLGGITLRVGEGAGATAATHRLTEPEQLRRWLHEIA
jgi:trehalose 6-phosphate phosphatase